MHKNQVSILQMYAKNVQTIEKYSIFNWILSMKRFKYTPALALFTIAQLQYNLALREYKINTCACQAVSSESLSTILSKNQAIGGTCTSFFTNWCFLPKIYSTHLENNQKAT